MSSAAVEHQRRRLTVSHGDSAGAGGRSSKGEDQQTTLEKAGLSEVFHEKAVAGRKAVSISSITDKDLKRRKSFESKDEVILCPAPLEGQEKELKQWVKGNGVGWACKKGLKPESPNQDSFAILSVENCYNLYGVFDGHGPNGHDVSDFVRIHIGSAFLRHPKRDTDVEKAFTDAFFEVQSMLVKHPKVDSSTSGTTCTLAYHDIPGDRLVIAHAGDSRSVLGKKLKSGSKLEAEDLTDDHKPNLPAERERIENAKPPGRVVFDGFYNYRVFAMDGMYPGLNMSRALGDVVAHDEAGLTCKPDVKIINLKEQRESCSELILLICTDGVWEFIESAEAVKQAFGAYQGNPANVMTACEKLASESWNEWMKDSDHEISDDITAIMVTFK